MPDNAVKFSVIIPVYNSTESLPLLAGRIDRVFREVVKEPYEVIMVDDGSPNPGTWAAIESTAKRFPTVRAFQLTRNFGKAGALICGFEYAAGEYIITMDDDLQHKPEDIPALLTEKGHDIVIGNFREKKHSLFVRVTSHIKSWFDLIIIGRPKHIKVSPYNLIKAEVAKSMLRIKTPYPFIPALMFYVTKDIASVYVSHEERAYGKSGFTFIKRVGQFSRLLINNSSLLLRTVAVVGFAMAFFSIIYSVHLIIRKLYQEAFVLPGWTSLMVVVLITSGLVLFSLGVVGEYLIRIINGTEGRPPYIVRKKSGGGH